MKIAPLTTVNPRNFPAANNAFIAAQMKLEKAIDKLQAIRENMTPCENWAHAEGACYDVNQLIEAVNRLEYLAKKGN